MSAPMKIHFVLFLCCFCLSGLSVATEQSSEDPDSLGFSVVAPPRRQLRKTSARHHGYTAGVQSPARGASQGVCPDPALRAYYRHKYTATTPHNTATALLRVAMGAHRFNVSSLAVTMATTASVTKAKPMCTQIYRDHNDTLAVQLVNSTSLLQLLGNKNDSFSHCTVVLFFAPWCMFCSQMAPHYNALPRAFPQLNFLAIDAVHFSSLNTRYGTIAVPNMLVFYNNSKAVAKYNQTERNYTAFVNFISGVTGFEANTSVTVLPVDHDGPLSSSPTQERDWLLWLAWAFVIVCFTTMFAKSTVGQRVWEAIANFGMEHENHHID